MSDIVSRTTPRHIRIRALPQAGSNDEAIVQLCVITITQLDDLEAEEPLLWRMHQIEPALP